MEKLYQKFSKINDTLLKIECVIGCIFLGILFFTMITNAALRYLFQSGLNWSDELNGFLFVWFGFLSASYIMGKGGHLSITAFVNIMPKTIRYALKQIMNIVMVVFSSLYVIALEQMLSKLSMSNVMRVPLKYIYIILPVSFCLMIIHILFNIVQDTYRFRKERMEG